MRNGNYLRQFGSVGTGPDQFTVGDGGHPHCVRIGANQLIYACDRGQNKINVYQRDGTFVGNIGVIPGQIGTGQEGSGTAWDIDFSKDPAQTFAFISDGQNEILWTFNHAGALAGTATPARRGIRRVRTRSRLVQFPAHDGDRFERCHLRRRNDRWQPHPKDPDQNVTDRRPEVTRPYQVTVEMNCHRRIS